MSNQYAPNESPTPGDDAQSTHARYSRPSSESLIPSLAPAAFHGPAGRFVYTVAPETEADPAAMLVQFLVTTGTVVGRGPHMRVSATRHGLNENALIVGRTNAGRKGEGGNAVKRFYRSVASRSKAALVSTQSGLSTGEGLINAVRDPSARRERNHRDDPGISDKRLLVVESEFASPLRVMQREGNTLSPVLRSAWDGEDLQTMTKGSPMRATAPHVGIIGHITPEELRHELLSTDLVNGFANRFLLVHSSRSRLLPDGGRFPDQELEPLIDEVRDVVESSQDFDVEIERDDEARARWHAVYPYLTRDTPGLYGAIIARGAAHVLRLSGIYALLDASTTIRIEHLEAALAVWEYSAASARFIFGDALGDPIADKILTKLRITPEGVTRSELTRDLFQRNGDPTRIAAALDLLVSAGLAYPRTERTTGRPAERWFAADATATAA